MQSQHILGESLMCLCKNGHQRMHVVRAVIYIFSTRKYQDQVLLLY